MRTYRLAPIAAAAVLMAGCTGSPDNPEEASSPAPASQETTPAATATSPAQDEETQTEWDVAPEDQAPLVRGDKGPEAAKDGDTKSAAKAATKTVEAFFHTKPKKKWWKGYAKHLTPAARDVWKYTDPANVPKGKVRNEVEVGQISATDAEVTVHSSIGGFRLVLVRESRKGPWLASLVEPPQEAQAG